MNLRIPSLRRGLLSRTLSILLSAVLMLGVVAPPSTAFAALDPNFTLSVSPAITGKTTYWTGEPVTLYVDITSSSPTAAFSDGTLRITLPSTYVSSVLASPIQSGTLQATQNVGGNWVITYKFSTIQGGTDIRIPVTVSSTALATPDNYTLPVSAQMLRSDGSVAIESAQLALNYEVAPPIMNKMLYSNIGLTSGDNQSVFAGLADPTNSTRVSDSTTTYVTFEYRVLSGLNGDVEPELRKP